MAELSREEVCEAIRLRLNVGALPEEAQAWHAEWEAGVRAYGRGARRAGPERAEGDCLG